MSKITTEDCKKIIKEHFSLSSEKTIKRERKFNDADGNIIREFKFDESSKCIVKECKQGIISIVEESELNKKEFNGKDFIKKYIKKFMNENNDPYEISDEYMEEGMKLSNEDKKILAKEFYYCFPLVYDNEIESITNGLDTPMFREGKYGTLTYGVFFHDSLKTDPELYFDEIVRVILPNYLNKVDENIFEMEKNKINKDMTIGDFVSMLDNLGFSHKNCEWFFGKEDDCMLHQLKLK